jgi:hypothetical protein
MLERLGRVGCVGQFRIDIYDAYDVEFGDMMLMLMLVHMVLIQVQHHIFYVQHAIKQYSQAQNKVVVQYYFPVDVF